MILLSDDLGGRGSFHKDTSGVIAVGVGQDNVFDRGSADCFEQFFVLGRVVTIEVSMMTLPSLVVTRNVLPKP